MPTNRWSLMYKLANWFLKNRILQNLKKWRFASIHSLDSFLVLKKNIIQKVILRVSTSLFLGSANLYLKVSRIQTFLKIESKHSRKRFLPKLKKRRRASLNPLNSTLLRSWCLMCRVQIWLKKVRPLKDISMQLMLIFGSKWSQCFSILHMQQRLDYWKKLKQLRETILRWFLCSNIPTSHS